MSHIGEIALRRRADAALLLFFWCLYGALGALVASTTVMQRGDNMFFHDAARIIMDITKPDYNHLRTAVHPLYVLLFNPFGTALRVATGSYTLAALVVNAFFGAVCVVLARVFFQKAGFSAGRALTYALLLGFSASHVFFGSIPSTGIMGAAAIVFSFVLLFKRPGDLRWFVPAGVLSMGVTTTNIVHTAAAYAASLRPGRTLGFVCRKTVMLAILVALVLAPLNVLQKVLYPSSNVMFLPRSYKHDAPYIAPFSTVREAAARVYKLAGHVLLYSYAAPKTHIASWEPPDEVGVRGQEQRKQLGLAPMPFITFDVDPLPRFSLVGGAAAALWLFLAGMGSYGLWLGRGERPAFVNAMALTIAFNVCLHTVYGDDFFLYSPHWAFLAIACVAVGLGRVERADGCAARWVRAALPLSVAVIATNSLMLMRDVYGFFVPYK